MLLRTVPPNVVDLLGEAVEEGVHLVPKPSLGTIDDPLEVGKEDVSMELGEHLDEVFHGGDPTPTSKTIASRTAVSPTWNRLYSAHFRPGVALLEPVLLRYGTCLESPTLTAAHD